MSEKLKRDIAKEMPNMVRAFYKSDHDDYTPEYWHFYWKEEYTPIQDVEWPYIVDKMVMKTKANNSVDYWTALKIIICEDYDEPDNNDGTTLCCMLYATWQQKARAYFLMREKLRGTTVSKEDLSWQDKFKKTFKNGPVKRKPRKK